LPDKGRLLPKEMARWIHLQGLFRDGAVRGFFPVDLHRASLVRGEAGREHAGWWLCPVEEAKFVGLLPCIHPYDSNRGWHGEWFHIRNPVEAPFPPFTRRRPERWESWSWGPSS